MENLLAPDFKLILAILAVATAYFQWQKTREQERNYRRQLVSLLHHAEGVSNSIRQIQYQSQAGGFSSVKDMESAVQAVAQNAEALFFGLIEYKVGDTSIKDEVDKKYSEWVDLSLDVKKKPLKDFLAQHPDN